MSYTDYGTLEQVVHQPWGTPPSSFNDVFGTTVTQQSHSGPPVSSPCGPIINEEHFSTPESQSEASMEESGDQQPEVPAPRPGFRERWASKVTLNPWKKRRSSPPVAGKKRSQTEQKTSTLTSTSNREFVSGRAIVYKVQKDEIPELRMPFFPDIPVPRVFWRVLLGLDGTGDLQDQVRIYFTYVPIVAYLLR